MNAVLLIEANKYNNLINIITNDIDDLCNGLIGKKSMDDNLDNICEAILSRNVFFFVNIWCLY